MFFELKSYLKFLSRSQNQHGLHSPFIYDLVTKCFYDKTSHPEYALIKSYRNNLLRNRQKIKVTDFGAGSRVFKSDVRPVFAIAKNAGITLHRAKLLFRLTKYLNIEYALELGTSLGIASAAIAANKQTELTTIEGCKETANIAKMQFEKYEMTNIRLVNDSFDSALSLITSTTNFERTTPNSEPRTQKFDMVLFDGNHQKDATLKYFEELLPTTHNDSVFIFDDIHWSPGMEEAWEEIKKHPEVRVTIDTYKWGLVFFRQEQAKQDFTIRV
ncbi:class I SAM-dependent methyltransferase [Gramella jeungdoensis]|uniref:Class I SAM-dependent methyltransferase n=1 Tax=Gramella jeungdoensis TaxID=708091 RepID=A0ABT0Z0T6_9FLAO|nr:class I SAM-dependent methyltransferase [Gramella jeungdoensis]MCM8569184.1 class I SAM-dependent methyltransferase [Gramella jeungdoensis]